MFIPLKDNMPKATFPMMTFILIALNVAIYFMASSNPIAAQNTAILYGVIPYELTNAGTQCVPSADLMTMVCGTTAEIQAMYPGLDMPPTWMTVASSMFLHGGLMHLIGNMLFLFVFGGALENALGKLSFSLFYLVGGVAAVLGPDSLGHRFAGPDGRRFRRDRIGPGRLHGAVPEREDPLALHHLPDARARFLGDRLVDLLPVHRCLRRGR